MKRVFAQSVREGNTGKPLEQPERMTASLAGPAFTMTRWAYSNALVVLLGSMQKMRVEIPQILAKTARYDQLTLRLMLGLVLAN